MAYLPHWHLVTVGIRRHIRAALAQAALVNLPSGKQPPEPSLRDGPRDSGAEVLTAAAHREKRRVYHSI
jgi:hypothetical protein